MSHLILGASGGLGELVGVGHRVVHGGSRFTAPTRVDDEVLAALDELAPLAPLHNPANAEGIRRADEAFPGVPGVAVFDTAFHRTVPAPAHTYAVPRSWREEHEVRRFGFHGTSHAYVTPARRNEGPPHYQRPQGLLGHAWVGEERDEDREPVSDTVPGLASRA